MRNIFKELWTRLTNRKKQEPKSAPSGDIFSELPPAINWNLYALLYLRALKNALPNDYDLPKLYAFEKPEGTWRIGWRFPDKVITVSVSSKEAKVVVTDFEKKHGHSKEFEPIEAPAMVEFVLALLEES